MKIALLPLPFFLLLHILNGQAIRIQPYLQDASPNSIHILWETDSGEESTVEWGLSEELGFETTGIAYPSNGNAQVHAPAHLCAQANAHPHGHAHGK